MLITVTQYNCVVNGLQMKAELLRAQVLEKIEIIKKLEATLRQEREISSLRIGSVDSANCCLSSALAEKDKQIAELLKQRRAKK